MESMRQLMGKESKKPLPEKEPEEQLMDRYTRNTSGKWKLAGYSRLPNIAIHEKILGKAALLTLWVLSIRTFKGKDVCFPSLKTMESETRYAKNTIIKAIRELEKCGYLRVERAKKGSKKTNRYYLLKRII